MGSLFRKEVLDSKKNRFEGTICLVQPPIFKSLTLFIVFVVVLSALFISIGSYTQKEHALGILQPNKGIIKLKAQQAGIISEMLVSEGQEVKKNQPILRVKSEKFNSSGFELNQLLIDQKQYQINNLSYQLKNTKNMYTTQVEKLKNERSNLKQRINLIDIQNDIFQKRLTINTNIVSQIMSLADTGYISNIELKRQNDILLSLKQQFTSKLASKLLLTNQLKQIKSKLIELSLKQSKIISQLETKIEEIKLELAIIEQQRFSELRAPTDGIVTSLLVKVGKNIAVAQNVLSIIPKGSIIQAILFVPTASSAFIEKGQKVKLRYLAFPYEKFGIYEGKISEVSGNIILPSETNIPNIISQPSYRVITELLVSEVSAYGRKIPLKSGMRLDADIIIKERSLFQWLFDPIFSITGNLL